ncbi:olfactory receptor 4C15-like [Microtus oregoni]|uniref:olfactory receptor 4C15-like n=1 Tax=Microtus oregoni TaxID=111838 RepID=UPI001BB1A1B6|nr:olfactory receptor 4C15-like [Microtus oregoni]
MADSIISSTVTPKIIIDCFYERKTISFECCMTQLFTVHFFTGAEVIVLAAMAYDRYVAICKPLFFHHDQRLCAVLVLVSGAGGFLHSIIQIIFTLQLPLCGTNIIDHYMCDLFPLLKLACIDTHIFVLLVFANSGAICIIFFSLLLVSYGVILFSLRAHSSEGRYKALSTCRSHITVVFLFFVPCILIYARPTSALSFEKNILVFVNVLTPLLNPMVYTFRNKEMMNAIRKMWKTFTVVSDKF